MTTSNASAAVPPCAVGSVSGPMTFSCSMIEPGQPWVMITGSAFGCFDFTWMKWMSSPSMLVMKLRIGEELRLGAAPVVVVGPIIGELLHGRELHALRVVVDGLALGPLASPRSAA